MYPRETLHEHVNHSRPSSKSFLLSRSWWIAAFGLLSPHCRKIHRASAGSSFGYGMRLEDYRSFRLIRLWTTAIEVWREGCSNLGSQLCTFDCLWVLYFFRKFIADQRNYLKTQLLCLLFFQFVSRRPKPAFIWTIGGFVVLRLRFLCLRLDTWFWNRNGWSGALG